MTHSFSLLTSRGGSTTNLAGLSHTKPSSASKTFGKNSSLVRRLSSRSLTTKVFKSQRHSIEISKDFNFESPRERDTLLKNYVSDLVTSLLTGVSNNNLVDATAIIHLRLYSICYAIYGLIVDSNWLYKFPVNLKKMSKYESKYELHKHSSINKFSQIAKNKAKDLNQQIKVAKNTVAGKSSGQHQPSPNQAGTKLHSENSKINMIEPGQEVSELENFETSEMTAKEETTERDGLGSLPPRAQPVLNPPKNTPNFTPTEALFYYTHAADRILGYVGITKHETVEIKTFENQSLDTSSDKKLKAQVKCLDQSFKKMPTINVLGLGRYFDLMQDKEEAFNLVVPKLSETDDVRKETDALWCLKRGWNSCSARILEESFPVAKKRVWLKISAHFLENSATLPYFSLTNTSKIS